MGNTWGNVTREGVFPPELRPTEVPIRPKGATTGGFSLAQTIQYQALNDALCPCRCLAPAAHFDATANAQGEILGVSDPPL